jgi:quinol monooxygenase YgiN
MAKMIINQRVDDFRKWKSVFDSVHPLRRQFGCLNEEIYQAQTNPNELVIITQWSDADQARKYGSSPELLDAMRRGGISGQPNIYYVE